MHEPRHGRRRRRGVWPFFGLSLLLHLQLVLVLVVSATINPRGCGDAARGPLPAFEVAVVAPSEVAEQLRLQRLQRGLREQEEREEREERRLEGQVVALSRPAEEQRPERAKYLSEYDSKVARETKAPPRAPGDDRPRGAAVARSGGRPAGAAEAPASGAARPSPRLAMRGPPSPQPQPQPAAPAPAAPPAPSGPSAAAVARLPGAATAAPAPGSAEPAQPPATPADTPGAAAGAATGPSADEGIGRLMISDGDMLRALGGGGSNDALRDVEEGEETLLNSRRWRFASFFNRVKQQVAQNWHPDRVYRRRDPTGNVYGFQDRLTVLVVTLDPRGGLQDVKLEQPSGLAFLDEEAISAFRLAQPFPNPPRGLVDHKSGQISFRFGFLFELRRQPSFRVLRFDGG